MPTCREESGQGKERSVWAGLLVRRILEKEMGWLHKKF
jgi:hypothetical protein